jgi:hypothetical protein
VEFGKVVQGCSPEVSSDERRFMQTDPALALSAWSQTPELKKDVE